MIGIVSATFVLASMLSPIPVAVGVEWVGKGDPAVSDGGLGSPEPGVLERALESEFRSVQIEARFAPSSKLGPELRAGISGEGSSDRVLRMIGKIVDAKYLLVGEARGEGGKAHVTLRLIEIAEGRLLFATRTEPLFDLAALPEADLIRLTAERIAARVAAHVQQEESRQRRKERPKLEVEVRMTPSVQRVESLRGVIATSGGIEREQLELIGLSASGVLFRLRAPADLTDRLCTQIAASLPAFRREPAPDRCVLIERAG